MVSDRFGDLRPLPAPRPFNERADGTYLVQPLSVPTSTRTPGPIVLLSAARCT